MRTHPLLALSLFTLVGCDGTFGGGRALNGADPPGAQPQARANCIDDLVAGHSPAIADKSLLERGEHLAQSYPYQNIPLQPGQPGFHRWTVRDAGTVVFKGFWPELAMRVYPEGGAPYDVAAQPAPPENAGKWYVTARLAGGAHALIATTVENRARCDAASTAFYSISLEP